MDWLDGEGRGDQIAAGKAFAEARKSGLVGRTCGAALAKLQRANLGTLQQALSDQGSASPSPRLRLAEIREEYLSYNIARPALDFAFRWLEAHLPEDDARDGPVLVHGDFRSGNIIAHPERGLVGILDWELAHLGNRYEDVAWMCVPSWRFGNLGKQVGGFADLADFCRGYDEAGGAHLDPEKVQWWTLLGCVRWGLICIRQYFFFRSDGSRFENGIVGRRTTEAELDTLLGIADMEGGLSATLAKSESLNPSLRSALREGKAVWQAAQHISILGDAGVPSDSELLEALTRELKAQAQNLAAHGDTRSAYVLRVAGNAASIVQRGSALRPSAARAEIMSARALLAEAAPGRIASSSAADDAATTTTTTTTTTAATATAASSSPSSPPSPSPSPKASEKASNSSAGALEEEASALRKRFALLLRTKKLSADAPGLLQHLLMITGRDVAIDQPKYPSFASIKSAL
mmetsp:Transcript_72319/g.150878  ORF Transcript_72319/g.150878 Transcript_72319/m.150878 type:complete len:463 (+) Transcript_72319:2-1390(+)